MPRRQSPNCYSEQANGLSRCFFKNISDEINKLSHFPGPKKHDIVKKGCQTISGMENSARDIWRGASKARAVQSPSLKIAVVGDCVATSSGGLR